MKIQILDVIRKRTSAKAFLKKNGLEKAQILNTGSSGVDFGNNSINIDIQNKKGIHCLCDVHHLPFKESAFDIVIITGVLQYCQNPYGVASEISRVLKENGLIYVDAPFVQPYCYDTPDLFRYTRDGLITVFNKEFIIKDCNTSIPGGSSLAFYIQSLVGKRRNRYANFIIKYIISLIVFPLSFLNFNSHPDVAGALYLIGKK